MQSGAQNRPSGTALRMSLFENSPVFNGWCSLDPPFGPNTNCNYIIPNNLLRRVAEHLGRGEHLFENHDKKVSLIDSFSQFC